MAVYSISCLEISGLFDLLAQSSLTHSYFDFNLNWILTPRFVKQWKKHKKNRTLYKRSMNTVNTHWPMLKTKVIFYRIIWKFIESIKSISYQPHWFQRWFGSVVSKGDIGQLSDGPLNGGQGRNKLLSCIWVWICWWADKSVWKIYLSFLWLAWIVPMPMVPIMSKGWVSDSGMVTFSARFSLV